MTSKMRILAVDDNPINLGIVEEMLCEEFRIEFARSGRDAICLAAALPTGHYPARRDDAGNGRLGDMPTDAAICGT